MPLVENSDQNAEIVISNKEVQRSAGTRLIEYKNDGKQTGKGPSILKQTVREGTQIPKIQKVRDSKATIILMKNSIRKTRRTSSASWRKSGSTGTKWTQYRTMF